MDLDHLIYCLLVNYTRLSYAILSTELLKKESGCTDLGQKTPAVKITWFLGPFLLHGLESSAETAVTQNTNRDFLNVTHICCICEL